MATTFNLTDAGREFLAANGSDKLKKYKLADVAVGAGTELDPIQTPSPTLTSQDNIVHFGGVADGDMTVSMDASDLTQVIYRIFLNESVGNFQYTQIGLYAETETEPEILCAVANSVPMTKYKTGEFRQGDTRELILAIPITNADLTGPVEISADASYRGQF